MKMFDVHGGELMSITSMERKKDDLIMKGQTMGYMPATIYVKPEQIWQSKKLLSWSVIWYLPVIIVKGWWRSRKQSPNI